MLRRTSISIVALTASLGLSNAIAVQPSDAQTRYQMERAACDSGQSHQDRAACLRDAGAAYEEARRGRLDDGRAQYQQNALMRCSVLPAEERGACQARMQGQGTTRGSVAEGGIYRELVTREAAPESSPTPEAGAGGSSKGSVDRAQ